MKEILKQIAENNDWQFIKTVESYLNYVQKLDDTDKDVSERAKVLGLISSDDIFEVGEFGGIDTNRRKPTGKFLWLYRSRLDMDVAKREDDLDKAELILIEKVLKTASCENTWIRGFKVSEVRNYYDTNMDGFYVEVM